MQTLGVSRFTIEGKPGGPIVFACLIPVAGRQAVTERFEAEGDDIIQAAQAVSGALFYGVQPNFRATNKWIPPEDEWTLSRDPSLQQPDSGSF